MPALIRSQDPKRSRLRLESAVGAMVRSRWLLGAALLLAACGSGAPPDAAATADLGTIDGRTAPPKRTPDRLDAIPDVFRGQWAAAGTGCGPLSDGVLGVTGGGLRFHESVARPTFILREDARSIALELAFSGKGERWTETTALRVRPDGRLSRRDPDGREVLYARCAEDRG